MLLQNILRTMGVDAAAAAPAWEDWDGSANGLAAIFESASTIFISACALSENKVVVVYRDSGNSSYGTACVLDISGSSISTGTPFVYTNAVSNYKYITKLSESTALLLYTDFGNTTYPNAGTACVLTIKGNSISAGAKTVFEPAGSYFISACSLNSTKVIATYIDEGNLNYGTACVLTVSGTTVSAGTPVVFETSEADYTSVTVLSETSALVAYKDSGNGGAGTACILSVSETTVFAGPQYVFNSSNSLYFSTCALSSSKVLVAYQNGATAAGIANVLDISGTSIASGEAFTLTSVTGSAISCCSVSNDKVIVVYTGTFGSSNVEARILNISGTSISALDPVLFKSGTSNYMSICTLSATKAIVAYQDYTNSFYGTAIVLQSNQ